MIRLNVTTKILQLIATATADVTVTGSDKTSTAYTGFSQETAATVSTQTIGNAPGASTVRDIDHVTIKTTGGANTLTVQIFNSSGSITTQQTSISILTGETLEYTHALGWGVIDVNGSRKEVTTSTFSSLTNTGGTATRVLFYGVNGLHSDDAGFTFNTTGDILTVGAINVAGTTAPTVGFYNPSGTLLRTPNSLTVDGTNCIIGNAVSGALHLLTVGNVSESTGAALRLLGYSATNKNWQIGIGDVSGSLTFTPSTAVGGSTFTTAAVSISGASAVTLAGHVSGTPTWVSGDKYLVVDASGNIHVSAVGPAS